jgi:SAM-dependent methyltransferase
VVTGVDLAPPLVDKAREIESTTPEGIRYIRGDVSNVHWWDRQQFDGVVCNMALTDIDDLGAVLRTIWFVLRPGGWFNISLLHPPFLGSKEPTVTHSPVGRQIAATGLRAGGRPGRPASADIWERTIASCRPISMRSWAPGWSSLASPSRTQSCRGSSSSTAVDPNVADVGADAPIRHDGQFQTASI